MSESQTTARGARDDKTGAQNLRFTPLRSYVMARTPEARSDPILSRLVPQSRLQS